MKLRFRGNSLRLRLNQNEVTALASGESLTEEIRFPGNTSLAYALKTNRGDDPQAFFTNGSIQIAAPHSLVLDWANSDEIGLYFAIPTSAEPLTIAVEKDLVCIDGPVEEIDPLAFPRLAEKAC